MTLGEAMKAWREEFTPPLTIPQAACIARVSLDTWRFLETPSKFPALPQATKDLQYLCRWLNLSADELLGLQARTEEWEEYQAGIIERYKRTGDPRPDFFCGLPEGGE